MRLLNIIQCTNLGGMERSNLARLKGLMARGHEVEVISLTPLGALAPFLREAAIPAIGLDYAGILDWRTWLSMRRAFRGRHPDAILMTGHNLAASLCLLGIRTGRKVQAIHYHHFEKSRDTLKWRVIYRAASAVFDHFTFCSSYIFDEALSVAPELRGKATVLPNPLEVPPAFSAADREAARRALSLPPSAPIVGIAGWLIARKRFDLFLRTAAEIARQRPNALFLIAGDGPERTALEAQARELGIADKVRFLGWVPDLTSFFRSLDVLLFNSDFDALPRVALEAAALGIPVVASLLRGGLSEALRPPAEIALFAEHDVDALAGAVLRLLDDPAARTRQAAAARQRVADYCSVEVHARTIEHFLVD